jgi:hypothetical protein
METSSVEEGKTYNSTPKFFLYAEGLLKFFKIDQENTYGIVININNNPDWGELLVNIRRMNPIIPIILCGANEEDLKKINTDKLTVQRALSSTLKMEKKKVILNTIFQTLSTKAI